MFRQAKRHQDILDLLSQCSFASTEELVAQLDVSPQTIRRDLNELAEQGKILRHHGGASLPSMAQDNAAELSQDQLWQLARSMAKRIPDGASLFISSGPVLELLARALLDHRDLHVVTNNLNIAATLTARDDVQVYLTGGEVCNRDGRLTGEAGCDFIRSFRMDYCLLEAWSLDDSGDLFGQAAAHVRAEQLMLGLARQRWLVVTPQAQSQHGMFYLDTLQRFEQVFSAELLPANLTAQLPATASVVTAQNEAG